ncbi:MAG TPA: hypothetical protein VFJ58_10070 [Armatimonadota bacterium]|nr:hypothetical protein [Armatimonadota bacterium]
MITGRVNQDIEAVVVSRIGNSVASPLDVEFVIDTGFNDYVTLTPSLVAALQLQYQYTSEAVLANGAIVSINGYQAEIEWDGRERTIPVYELDSGPSIGMALLEGHRLCMDVVDDGLLTIEPMP